MSNLTCFSLQYVMGTSMEVLRKKFQPEYQMMQMEPSTFTQLLVLEYRALAAVYHTCLSKCDTWCDPKVFEREAPSEFAEFECGIFLQDTQLSEFIKSRGTQDLREFLNLVVDRHNALAAQVYSEITCGLPWELFQRMTRCEPLTPGIMAQALFFYKHTDAKVRVWLHDEILDIDLDHLLSSDYELSRRLALVTGTPLTKIPFDHKLTEAYDAYMKGVFVNPGDLSQYSHIYAMYNVDGTVSEVIQHYIDKSRENSVAIDMLWRKDITNVEAGSFVISDDHIHLRRLCTMRPSISFGCLTPLPTDVYRVVSQRKQPNLYIVKRY